MTFTEAAVEVLRLVGKPLHYKRITEIAIERNLLSHVGKTPEITMSSRLATMVKKDRGDAPIIKVKPGIFGLRDFPDDVLKAADLDATEAEAPELIEIADVAEAFEGAEAVEASAAPSEPPVEKPARSEHKLPGSEVFPEEDDDDEPILAKLDEESEREDEANKKRKRRRRRRRPDEVEGVEESEPAPRDHRGADRDRERAGRERSRDRDRTRERDRDRGERPVREERRRELAGDWHREPAEGDVVGKDLSDAMVGALESLGGQRPRPLSRVADELVRRGRLSGDPAALVPTLAAAARADDAKREARQHRPRFRLHGDEVGLLEWALPPEAARVEREVEQAARKQRDFVRRAFIRRLSELPTAAFMELLATWLNVVGVTALRGIRRPGSSGGELHLAGLLKQGPLETPLAIVIVRDGGSIGREKVVEIRGGLHHYGSASAAWLITLGQVLSGAREEASAAGAVPCALFDGQELARSMEEARVGLRTYVVPVVGLDIDLLDSLRGPGARPVQQPPQQPPRREPEPAARPAVEVPTAEVEAETEGEAGGNGKRRRRRRRRRGGAGAAEELHGADALQAVVNHEGAEGESLEITEGDEITREPTVDEESIEPVGESDRAEHEPDEQDDERLSDLPAEAESFAPEEEFDEGEPYEDDESDEDDGSDQDDESDEDDESDQDDESDEDDESDQDDYADEGRSRSEEE